MVATLEDKKKLFEETFNTNKKRLEFYVFTIIGDREEAKDILQSAFEQGLKAIAHLRENSSCYPWLFSITRHLALGYIRAKKRESSYSKEDRPEDYSDDYPTQEYFNPEESAARKEERDKLRIGLYGLPFKDRRLLELELQDTDREDIGRVLKMESSAVRVGLHRARKRLRAILEENN